MIFANIILVIVSFNISGQEFSISNLKQNILFRGIDNPIHVASENYSCDSIWLSTNNGIVQKKGPRCFYIVRVEDVGLTELVIYSTNGNDTIILEKKEFRAIDIPMPIVKCAGKHGGTISKKSLIVQHGLFCELEGFEFDLLMRVEKYTILLLREDSLIQFVTREGNKFDTVVYEFLSNIEKDDKILFANISGIVGDRKVHFQPIEFIIE